MSCVPCDWLPRYLFPIRLIGQKYWISDVKITTMITCLTLKTTDQLKPPHSHTSFSLTFYSLLRALIYTEKLIKSWVNNPAVLDRRFCSIKSRKGIYVWPPSPRPYSQSGLQIHISPFFPHKPQSRSRKCSVITSFQHAILTSLLMYKYRFLPVFRWHYHS